MKCKGCFREISSDYSVCPYCAKQVVIDANEIVEPSYDSVEQQFELQDTNSSTKDPSKNWAAVVALVCGILSIVACFTFIGSLLFGIAAIIFGIIGTKSQKKDLSIVGLVLGCVGLVFSLFILIMIFGLVGFVSETVTNYAYSYDLNPFDYYDFDEFLTMFSRTV